MRDELLNLLRENAQRTPLNLAYRLKQSLPLVVEELERLDEVVERYCTLVDFEELGFPLRVQFFSKNIPVRESYINTLRQTDRGYFIEAIFPSWEILAKECGTDVHFVLEILKEEGFKIPI